MSPRVARISSGLSAQISDSPATYWRDHRPNGARVNTGTHCAACLVFFKPLLRIAMYRAAASLKVVVFALTSAAAARDCSLARHTRAGI
jgi:hypothetical protein